MNWKPIAVFVVATVLGFLLMGNAPLGKALWPPSHGPAEPEGTNLVLLMAIGAIEAVSFGLGACVLVFGLRHARNLTGTTGPLATAVWLSVTWLLVNWVPHTALHMNVGNLMTPEDFGGLVAIEYGFHLTLIMAGTVLMYTLFRVRQGVPAAAPAATPARAGRAS